MGQLTRRIEALEWRMANERDGELPIGFIIRDATGKIVSTSGPARVMVEISEADDRL